MLTNTSKNCLAECNTTEDLSCHNTVDNVSESAEQSALIKEVEKSSEKSGDSVDRLNSSSTSQESESGCQDPDYTPKDRLGRTCNAVKNSPSVSSRFVNFYIFMHRESYVFCVLIFFLL